MCAANTGDGGNRKIMQMARYDLAGHSRAHSDISMDTYLQGKVVAELRNTVNPESASWQTGHRRGRNGEQNLKIMTAKGPFGQKTSGPVNPSLFLCPILNPCGMSQ
jgi:hypothetical protein